MIEHQISIRVQYNETDQMGVVHHANYLKYMELGRIEWLRSLGISYADMEENGVLLPVVSVHVNFKSPASFDDILTLKTRLEKLPRGSIDFTYEMTGADHRVIMTGKVVLAFIRASDFRPVRCPDELLEVFRRHFQEPIPDTGKTH